MKSDYSANDYAWIRELMDYPRNLARHLDFFETTADIELPSDPIEKVIFQDKAKAAIRKIAQNRGHILMVGRPGTGKSMLANMFNVVLERSIGDYLRPTDAIAAYPGKDKNHIRIAYEAPDRLDKHIADVNQAIRAAAENVEPFSLADQIRSVRRMKRVLFGLACLSVGAGFHLSADPPGNFTHCVA